MSNLTAGTVLQGYSCLSSVKPICWHCVEGVQLFKQCRNLSNRHCAAGVQLFMGCRNLSASTVLQGCSCLSCVTTYLPALCCRDAAVYVVLKPTCSCLSGVKTCLPYCAAGVKLFKWCQNLSAGTMFQGCSC